MMSASACAASFANSAVLEKWPFFIAGVLAILFSQSMSAGPFEAYGVITLTMAGYCAMQLAYRGGADLVAWLAISDRHVTAARVAWLAGAAVLIAYAGIAQVASPLYQATMWAWLMTGTLLMRPTIQQFFAIIGALVIRGFAYTLFPGVKSLTVAPMNMLSFGLIYVAIFLVVNMKRAKTNQHQFT
jgi:hypothetical protein